MINVVVLVGRLTKDPEKRVTGSGVSSCRFTLAVDRTFKNQQTGQRETDFINCIAWRSTADLMCQYLSKGSLIGVTGRIQTGSYENQQGVRVYTTDVVADSVQFLEPRGARAPQAGQYQNNGYQNNNYSNQGGYGQQNYGNGGYGQGQNFNPQGYGQPAPAANAYTPKDYGQNAAQSAAGDNPYSAKINNNLNNAFDDSDTLNIADDDLPF